jgi:hypothetical protein
MGISFPNQAHSYDDRNRCVRFSGYDGMLEVKFYVAAVVLVTASLNEPGGLVTDHEAEHPSRWAAVLLGAHAR